MKQKVNKVFKPLYTQKVRYFFCMGGRGTGRSYAASQYATSKLVAPEYFRCAIMRFIYGDIRNSIFQEIIDRATEQEILGNLLVKEFGLTISYGKNKINGIGFRKSSSDQKSKLKSLAAYNCVIIEEADEVSEEDFQQLDDSLRTIKSDIVIIFCLNVPYKNHWIIKRFFNLEPSEIEGFYLPVLKPEMTDVCYIPGDYRDNIKNLNKTTVENYERYKKTRPDHYWNMIRGLVSEGARGRIFKNWQRIPDAEFEALPYPSYYGLDFGYSNHPTALVEIKQHNDKIWGRELVYETGLTNQKIAKRLENLGISREAAIYADSAEPKSIAEIREENWNILPASKGPDSIHIGIDMLLDKEVCYNESSENFPIETQEYRWALDKNKEPTNEPIDDFNHLMDALRYGVYTHSVQPFVGFV